MGRIVMGYWDCKYCNNKGIEGTSQKCPSCGATREAGTKFYLKDGSKTYLSEEQSKTKGKGADWICPYCNALNSVLINKCENCGSNKYESTENYFGPIKKEKSDINSLDYSESLDIDTKNVEDKIDDEMETEEFDKNRDSIHSDLFDNEEDDKKEFSRFSHIKEYINSDLLLKFAPALAALLIIVLSIVITYAVTKPKEFTPTDFSWKTTIKVEHYETVNESDWSIPTGGRETSHESRIHHYNHVIDHYRTVTKTRSVQDGYDVSYSYSSNGDGTFTEHEHCTPRYRTETYTEQEPVYRDDPVYKTYYYYDIEKWIFKYDSVMEGTGKEISWKEVELEDSSWRISNRIEEYFVSGTIKNKEIMYSVDKEMFYKLYPGEVVKIKTNFTNSSITEIIQ